MILAFTGHRPNKLLGHEQDVITAMVRKLQGLAPDKAISGMALGVDQWGARICVRMGIPFIAAVPFMGQESVWPGLAQREYRELLGKAERVEIVSSGGYESWKMQVRNQWMVDRADVILAVWDGSSGGTANCVRYAERLGKVIHRIDPRARS